MGNDWDGPVAQHRGSPRHREWTRAVWAVLAIYWFEVKMCAGLVPWEYIILGVGFAVIALIGFK